MADNMFKGFSGVRPIKPGISTKITENRFKNGNAQRLITALRVTLAIQKIFYNFDILPMEILQLHPRKGCRSVSGLVPERLEPDDFRGDAVSALHRKGLLLMVGGGGLAAAQVKIFWVRYATHCILHS